MKLNVKLNLVFSFSTYKYIHFNCSRIRATLLTESARDVNDFWSKEGKPNKKLQWRYSLQHNSHADHFSKTNQKDLQL